MNQDLEIWLVGAVFVLAQLSGFAAFGLAIYSFYLVTALWRDSRKGRETLLNSVIPVGIFDEKVLSDSGKRNKKRLIRCLVAIAILFVATSMIVVAGQDLPTPDFQ